MPLSRRRVKAFFYLLVFLALAGVSVYLINKYYGYLFSKEIRGEVLKVEKVTNLSKEKQKANDEIDLHQFALAVKELKSKEIYTVVSTDCQWSVVSKGYCVVAKFLPYPPWNLKKHGNFIDARLLRLMECKEKSIEGGLPTEKPIETPNEDAVNSDKMNDNHKSDKANSNEIENKGEYSE